TNHSIQCVVQYYPLYRYPFYKKLGLAENSCPNTDQFFDSMISFPFHHSLRESELTRILQASYEVVEVLRQE
ncbi:MAG: DegT/DnrJ/EryC1/StrS family aminotransferase, partial [Candidatus Poribacteria bacterium]|nr:DegT/DnrJ/EryC1/StrS family aminotransferase [Candidatus Poribacteria bacterium]